MQKFIACLSLLVITPSLLGVEPLEALTPNSRVLFQGDSITDGNRGRTPDPNHILGHGYVFIVAARHGAAFPEAKYEFLNRGVSGNTVYELEKRWQNDTLELKPDVLSVLIGVNDSGRKIPLAEYEQAYDKLLIDARTNNPRLKLVLCEPFWVDHKATKPANGSPNEDIVKRQEVVTKLATKHEAALARFQKALDEACKRAPASHWVWDSVHPTYSGHQILADEWERAVREHWKKKD